jgi:receptor protein-tyrosine kinase
MRKIQEQAVDNTIDLERDADAGEAGGDRPDRLSLAAATATLDAHVVTHGDRRSPIAGQYRAISARLFRPEHLSPPASVLFTSALSGEGKTTTVVNLGVALAEGGKTRVVIVDANLRSPALHRLMGIAGEQGLSEYLSGTVRLGEALVPGVYPNLALLPAGHCPENPTRLLSGAALRLLIQKLTAVFNHVLIDSPPIGLFSDAAVIAPHTDGVVLAVRAGRTPLTAVAQAQALIGRVDSPCLGAILTHARPE